MEECWLAKRCDLLASVLDSEKLRPVDVEVIHFRGAHDSAALLLVHCSDYVREWIARER